MVRDKAEFLSAAIAVGVGIFALCLAYSIETYEAEILRGPRLVPILIAILGIGISVLQLFLVWVRRGKSIKADGSASSDGGSGKRRALSKPAVLRMAAVIVIGFAYIWLLSATGYLVATAVATVPLLVVFGTRSAGKVAKLAIIGAVVYYLFFIRLMGIYFPPGWLFNPDILGF